MAVQVGYISDGRRGGWAGMSQPGNGGELGGQKRGGGKYGSKVWTDQKTQTS